MPSVAIVRPRLTSGWAEASSTLLAVSAGDGVSGLALLPAFASSKGSATVSSPVSLGAQQSMASA